MIDLQILINMVSSGDLIQLKTVIFYFKNLQYTHLTEDEFVALVTDQANEKDGKTLLHYAAEHNHLHIVNYLLSFNGASIHQLDKNRKHFLYYLYSNGTIDGLLPESIKEIKKTFPSFNPVKQETWSFEAMSREALIKLFERDSAENTKITLLNLSQQMTIPGLPPATASAEEFKKDIIMRLQTQIQAAALLASRSDSNQM